MKGLCEGLVCGCLMLLDFGPFGSWIQVQFKAPVLKAGCLQLFIAEYQGQGYGTRTSHQWVAEDVGQELMN